MKLIIPHAYNVPGGVEKVTCSLIKEFTELIDKVIWVLPENNIDYFKKIIPPSDKLIYESFNWLNNSLQNKYDNSILRILSTLKKVNLKKSRLYKILERKISKKEKIIKYLIRKYDATHCLYMIINAQNVPKIKIPIGGIVPDLFWLNFPNKYSEEFKKQRKENLIEWVKKADIIFAISNKTKEDILRIYNKKKKKIKSILLAANIINLKSKSINKHPIFYYPAGLNDHKNHLDLFKAAYNLTKKKLEFKIILTGKDTDLLTKNQHNIKSEKKTYTYYQKHKKILNKYIKAPGYINQDKVEEIYQNCSCVILPSIYEGFGLPLAEAIARGIPVICSDIEPFKEQIELYKCEDLVTVFPAKDNKALAKCMEEFIKNPKKRLSYEEVKKRFSHWTWKEAAKKYIEELEKISK